MHLKSNIYTVFLAFFCSAVSAQITLTNSYFPAAGDSFKVATATTATANLVRITPAGGNQAWNYNFLRSARNGAAFSVESYRAIASDTAAFRQYPDGELVSQTDSGQVAVLNRTLTKLELLGYKNFNLGSLSIPGISFRYSPPINERHAPLIYNAPTISFVSNFSAAIPSSALPDSLISALPFRPDSFRINYRVARQDKNDAWGTMLIPGASSPIPVLRERRFEETETRIEVKLGFFPWVDITPVLASTTGFRQAKDTTISYYFWSNTTKQPLVVVNLDAQDFVRSVQYKWQQIVADIKNTEGGADAVSMTLYPNPAKANSSSYLDIKGLKSNGYNVTISDIQGKIISKISEKNPLSETTTIKLPPLAVGLYLIELGTDKKQNGVKTMQLIVVQ